ncbi:MAG: PAS domain S-box-containing protein [Verrucomicrobiales bacterium]|jgi:PAS domain S-box-containing protein
MQNEPDDPWRLKSLKDSGLEDASPMEEFDRLTRIVTAALRAPVSLISLVDGRGGQIVKSGCGLPDSLLGDPFCEHIVRTNAPLVIEDLRSDPRFQEAAAVKQMGAVTCVGVPISLPGGDVIGSLCVIDRVPRTWPVEELRILSDFAAMATDAIRHLLSSDGDLIESRRRLVQILDSTGEGIYGIDAEGVCTFVNRKALALLGFSHEEEMLGSQSHDLIHHTYADGTGYPIDDCRILQAISSNENVYSKDEVFWKKDGTFLPVEYRSFPVFDGGPTRAVITFVDITEQLQQEREQDDSLQTAQLADREKSRFLANMSHEIRTPMNAILGFSELLGDMVENPKARSHVRAIRASGKSLLHLINDILDLSKIESGKMTVDPRPMSVRAMCESVRLLFAQQAAEANLGFDLRIDEACPDYLVVEEQRIRQILLNLISNALKFTQTGRIDVTFWAEKDRLDPRHVTLEIKVADTGIGIPVAKQRSVFLPFRQVDDSDSIGGTGLGLSICRGLAELCGGEISLVSEEGSGSEFRVTLPRTEVASGVDEAMPDVGSGTDFDLLDPSRVLVVDDNQFNRELVAGYLEGTHHLVTSANDGEEGVALARDWKPDVILMDIRMPRLDGKEARRRIKADPALAEIPVLAVTASSLQHQTHELRRDFDGYLRKPYSKRQLFRELAKVLPALEDSMVDAAIDSTEGEIEARLADPAGWVELVEMLRMSCSERVPHLLDAMLIGEIESFAIELAQAGRAAGCEALTSYAMSLKEQAALFQLSKIEATLGNFGELVERIASLCERALNNIK